jgi:hypothetical protein
MARADGVSPEMTSSMHHDLERGNRLEAPWLCGAVVEIGARHGVPTPCNRAVRDILAVHVNGRSDGHPLGRPDNDFVDRVELARLTRPLRATRKSERQRIPSAGIPGPVRSIWRNRKGARRGRSQEAAIFLASRGASSGTIAKPGEPRRNHGLT